MFNSIPWRRTCAEVLPSPPVQKLSSTLISFSKCYESLQLTPFTLLHTTLCLRIPPLPSSSTQLSSSYPIPPSTTQHLTMGLPIALLENPVSVSFAPSPARAIYATAPSSATIYATAPAGPRLSSQASNLHGYFDFEGEELDADIGTPRSSATPYATAPAACWRSYVPRCVPGYLESACEELGTDVDMLSPPINNHSSTMRYDFSLLEEEADSDSPISGNGDDDDDESMDTDPDQDAASLNYVDIALDAGEMGAVYAPIFDDEGLLVEHALVELRSSHSALSELRSFAAMDQDLQIATVDANGIVEAIPLNQVQARVSAVDEAMLRGEDLQPVLARLLEQIFQRLDEGEGVAVLDGDGEMVLERREGSDTTVARSR